MKIRNLEDDRGDPQFFLQSIVSDLAGSVGPESDTATELVITLLGENIPTREFAAYLALVDRLYGRLNSEGLLSYAHKKSGGLRITEIRKGSIEIIFRFLPHSPQEMVIAAILCLFLRSLPNMFKLATEGVRNLAETYKTVEEGRLIGQQRKALESESKEKQALQTAPEQPERRREEVRILREAIRSEPTLSNLNPKEQTYIVMILESLAHAENHNLPATVRFAHSQVRDVELKKGDDAK